MSSSGGFRDVQVSAGNRSFHGSRSGLRDHHGTRSAPLATSFSLIFREPIHHRIRKKARVQVGRFRAPETDIDRSTWMEFWSSPRRTGSERDRTWLRT